MEVCQDWQKIGIDENFWEGISDLEARQLRVFPKKSEQQCWTYSRISISVQRQYRCDGCGCTN